MTPERFRRLTEIYGAQPWRWPVAEREAALGYMRDRPAEAEAVLSEASALDGVLSRYALPHPSAALREKIIASAPAALKFPCWPAGLRWQFAGLAGLGLAGALAGAVVISVFLPLDRQGDDDESGYVVTAFDELSQNEPDL